MPILKPGDPAPALRLLTDSGEEFDLKRLQGARVILFFYPKAGTSGCTVEAREFRDAIAKLAKLRAVVIGISPDAPAAQTRFKTKEKLPYTLLCDVEHQAAQAYGVWREKSMYGRKYFGIVRTTFVIDPEGRIQHVFEKVKPAGHAGQVCSILDR